MSERKEQLEEDILKKLKGAKKIEALTKEINCLHFFPSTNIDTPAYTGNLHFHIWKVVKKAIELYHNNHTVFLEKSDALIEGTIILPAAVLAVTGLANCDGLSMYAYYRWFSTADLSNPEEMPILIRFLGDGPEGPETVIHHHVFAVDVNFNHDKYRENIIKLDNFNKYTPVDFWLKTSDKKEISEMTMKEYPDSIVDFSLPIATTCLKVLKKRQTELPLKFKNACDRFKTIFDKILSETFLPSVENCIPHKKGYYYHINTQSLIESKFVVDLKDAYAYMRKIYIERDNETVQLFKALPNIRHIWENLIRRISQINKTIYSNDTLPIVQEMVQKLTNRKSNDAGGLLTFLRNCCCKRRAARLDQTNVSAVKLMSKKA